MTSNLQQSLKLLFGNDTYLNKILKSEIVLSALCTEVVPHFEIN